MSRIGILPIRIPSLVDVELRGNEIFIKGPMGNLNKAFHDIVKIVLKNDCVFIVPQDNSSFAKSMHGTARSIIYNMISGVTKLYSKDLSVNGVGFRVLVENNNMKLNLGYSHSIQYTIPDGINVIVKENNQINISGCDKVLVGRVAADIKSYRPINPYKGKGIRVIGEFAVRKEGKKTA